MNRFVPITRQLIIDPVTVGGPFEFQPDPCGQTNDAENETTQNERIKVDRFQIPHESTQTETTIHRGLIT